MFGDIFLTINVPAESYINISEKCQYVDYQLLKGEPYLGSEPICTSSGPLRSAKGSQILVHRPSNRQVITLSRTQLPWQLGPDRTVDTNLLKAHRFLSTVLPIVRSSLWQLGPLPSLVLFMNIVAIMKTFSGPRPSLAFSLPSLSSTSVSPYSLCC